MDQAIDAGDLPADLKHSRPFDDMEVTGWAGWLTDGNWTYSITEAGITSTRNRGLKGKFVSDRRLPLLADYIDMFDPIYNRDGLYRERNRRFRLFKCDKCFH